MRLTTATCWNENGLMPLYEYACDAGHRFELIRKFSDPPLENCPTCGAPVHKLISSPAFQFKGTGWYITDYAKKDGVSSSTGDAKSEASTTKDENKNEKADKAAEKSEKAAKTAQAEKGETKTEKKTTGSDTTTPPAKSGS